MRMVLFIALVAALMPPASGAAQVGPPPQVVINRVAIAAETLRLMEQQFHTTVPPGRYWYDRLSGAWGLERGPTQGFTLPGLTLGGPMPADISGGGTGVYINGRELHPMDVAALTRLFGQVQPGRYWLDGQGYAGQEGQPAITNLFQVAQQLYRQNGGVGQDYGGGAGAYSNPRTGIGILTDGQGGAAVFGN